MLGDLAIHILNRLAHRQFLVVVWGTLHDLLSRHFDILVFDLLLEFLLLMLHDHALQSLYLLVVWCHVGGVLRLALLRQVIILNESVGAHIQHLIIYLILNG